MTYNGIITKKLMYLREQLVELRSWEVGVFAEFAKQTVLQRACERELQMCVEAVIDVCERILAIASRPPAETSVGTLEKVSELGLIKNPADYADMVRFRNFIVHRYELVDPEIIYDIVKNKLETFDQFIEEIELNTAEAEA